MTERGGLTDGVSECIVVLNRAKRRQLGVRHGSLHGGLYLAHGQRGISLAVNPQGLLVGGALVMVVRLASRPLVLLVLIGVKAEGS